MSLTTSRLVISRDTELSLRSLVSVDKLLYSRNRRRGSPTKWDSPFFYAKTPRLRKQIDPRRRKAEQYIDVTIFRSRDRLRMDEQKNLLMAPIGGGGLKKK